MPRVAKSKNQKVEIYIREFPNEFTKSFDGGLHCKLCNAKVSHEKRFNVQNHRSTDSHKQRLSSQFSQTTLAPIKDFSFDVCDAFLKADIPLWKLRSPSLVNLFSKIGCQLPSESTCRRRIDDIYDFQMTEIKKKIKDKQIFLIVDESDIDRKKILNIMIATIENSEKVYLAESKILQKSPNSNTVASLIDDFLKDWNIEKKNFTLLLSDAAPYMIACGKSLKIFYPNLVHITCVAHLLHNCSMRIQAHFDDVNNLIASFKMSVLKNQGRRDMFEEIGLPPDVVITRWGLWLKAACYFAKKLPKIIQIVNSFEDDGKIIARVKEAVNNPTLYSSLTKVVTQYKCILENIEKCESRSFSIKEAFEMLKDLDFEDDDCEIKEYLEKRRNNSELRNVVEFQNQSIDPSTYAFLLKCPASSAEVERSFSMIKKLLAKDRNFNVENIKKYACIYFNKI